MNKPPLAFFEPMEYYVYWYEKASEIYYVGKGINDRCWHHVVEKGYDPADLHIVARNLTEREAFLLESYLIFTHQPRDNKVSGKHQERFVMASIAGLFDSYSAGLRNMHTEMHEFMTEHDLYNLVSLTTSRSGSFLLQTPTKKSFWLSLIVSTETPEFVVRFATNKPSEFDSLLERLDERLGSEYELQTKESLKGTDSDLPANHVQVVVESAEEAVSFFKEF